MEKPTPRINSALREQYVDQTVRIIGKVSTFKDDMAVLETSDKGQVLVHLNGNNKWGSDYVEVIGKLTKEFALEEYKTNNLGNDLDLDLVEKVVQFSLKCPEMFLLD
ncbi:replication factor A protein 3 [Syncephalastrum racemosum]|uniref:Replication factor A protein 3 n=1 Tax=Syncephalastrum racemosum TaxID=13706 RepID=A0A1X2HFM2_SYNRA|nr:replication factor A protein 3 [Syncephalastrum racemosum]